MLWSQIFLPHKLNIYLLDHDTAAFTNVHEQINRFHTGLFCLKPHNLKASQVGVLEPATTYCDSVQGVLGP